ncbi:hypothetical protein ABX041_003786 [Salmonella enterica]|nr:hypothetical protein [Salmonella enterica subsp. enterica serovar Javiana]ECF2859379.1 hypothetical protein [Salmonella enterica subsp. enterica serovar Agona]
MNEITLVRFIEAMHRNEANPHSPLFIDLMEEEVEGFLAYPRLKAYFERKTPTAYEKLKYALDNRTTLNNTPFKALEAIDPTGGAGIPQRVVFYYIDNGRIKADVVNWISEGEIPETRTFNLCPVEEGWVAGTHYSYPYQSIKSPYLYPVYLDDVTPGKCIPVTNLICLLTMEVVASDAGQAWVEQSKNIQNWQEMGYKLYQP